MKDISKLINLWITCSNDLWKRWFINRINGAYDYIEIEDILLHVFVIRSLNPTMSALKTQDLFDQLRVQYINNFQENRQVCVTQKCGNIFCKTEVVTFKRGVNYKVKSIDTMGTMMNSEPYVEIIFGEKFILESPKKIKFLLTE